MATRSSFRGQKDGPAGCDQSSHLFYLLLPSGAERDRLIQYLKDAGIASAFHYLPLHLSPMGQRFGGKEGDCPVTEQISERLVRLPFFNGLLPADQDRVIETVRAFC